MSVNPNSPLGTWRSSIGQGANAAYGYANPIGAGSSPGQYTAQTNTGGGSGALTRYLEELANEDTRRFDEDHKIKKRQLDQQYEMAKRSARTEEERLRLDQEYRQQQIALTREQLAWDRDRFGQEFQQKAEQFAAQLGLSREEMAEGRRQFDAGQQQRESEFAREFGQRGYEFDTTTEEGRRRFDAEFGQRGYEFDTEQGSRRYEFDTEQGNTDREFLEGTRRYDTDFGESRRRYDTDFGEDTRRYDQDFGEDRRRYDTDLGQRESEFARTHGLNQAELGYNLLDTQARLAQNPEDYWYAAELARGQAEMPETATFLSALRGNTTLPGYGMQAGVGPTGSLQATEARMGYTPQAPGNGGALVPGPIDSTGAPIVAPPGGPVQPAPRMPTAGAANPGDQRQTATAAGVPAGMTYHQGQLVPISQVYGVGATGQPPAAGASSGVPAGMTYHQGRLVPISQVYGVGATGQPPSAGAVRPGAAVVNPVQQARQQRDERNLAAIRGIAQAGAHKLGAGALEGMGDTEFKLFKSGLGRAGADPETFMSQYRQSRIGNRSGMARVA